MMINNKMEAKTVVKSNKRNESRSDVLKVLNITRTRRSGDILFIVHSTKLKKNGDLVIFRRFANIFRRPSKGHTNIRMFFTIFRSLPKIAEGFRRSFDHMYISESRAQSQF